MGDVVNLNRFRKAAKKRDDKARAAANRALYGTPADERDRLEAERARAGRDLDGHRIETDDMIARPADGGDDGHRR
jgi:hypothetical protein